MISGNWDWISQQLMSVQMSQCFSREVQSREQTLLMICNTPRDKSSGLPYHHATGHPNESRIVFGSMYLFTCVSLFTAVQHKHVKWPASVLWLALASMGMLFGIWLWHQLGLLTMLCKMIQPCPTLSIYPPRQHLTFRSDCMPLYIYTLRRKTHTHSTSTENVKRVLIFFFS